MGKDFGVHFVDGLDAIVLKSLDDFLGISVILFKNGILGSILTQELGYFGSAELQQRVNFRFKLQIIKIVATVGFSCCVH